MPQVSRTRFRGTDWTLNASDTGNGVVLTREQVEAIRDDWRRVVTRSPSERCGG